jgi:peptidoglycan/xylan/chitin deacetylase (PgdA/CDA1 family)
MALRSILENTIGKAFGATGLNALYKAHHRSQCVVIIYHRILTSEEYHQGRSGVLVTEFQRQMRYIAANFTCLSLTTLGEFVKQRESPPPNSVVITFDDGYLDNYALAFPILRKHGLKATFFVCPGMIGSQCSFWWDRLDGIIENGPATSFEFHNRAIRLGTPKQKSRAKHILLNYILEREREAGQIIDELQAALGVKTNCAGLPRLMEWKQLQEMQEAGMEIGAHTMTHASMGPEAIRHGYGKTEIGLSKKHIEAELGGEVKSFAYPYGNERHFDPGVVRLLQQAGFDLAVSGVVGVTGMQDDLFYLSRIAIQAHDHFSLFKSKVSGLYPNLYRHTRKLLRALTNENRSHRDH